MEAWILRREPERVNLLSLRDCAGTSGYALCCSPSQSTAVGAPRSCGPTVRADRAGCAVRALSAPLRAVWPHGRAAVQTYRRAEPLCGRAPCCAQPEPTSPRGEIVLSLRVRADTSEPVLCILRVDTESRPRLQHAQGCPRDAGELRATEK